MAQYFILGRVAPFDQTWNDKGNTFVVKRATLGAHLKTQAPITVLVEHDRQRVVGNNKTNTQVILGDHYLLFAVLVDQRAKHLPEKYPFASVGFKTAAGPCEPHEISLVQQARLSGTAVRLTDKPWSDARRELLSMDIAHDDAAMEELDLFTKRGWGWPKSHAWTGGVL